MDTANDAPTLQTTQRTGPAMRSLASPHAARRSPDSREFLDVLLRA